MFKHSSCLLGRHARKPLDEIRQLSAIFKVLEQRCHGHARAAKHPGAAHAGRISLNNFAGGPVNHGAKIRLVPHEFNEGSFLVPRLTPPH